MRTQFLFCLVFMMTIMSCNKDDKDARVCEMNGKVMVWGLGAPAIFPAGDPPGVELYQMKELVTDDPLNPSLPYKVPVAFATVNPDGEFSFSAELEKNGQYFIDVSHFDTAVYVKSKAVPVQYKDVQTVNAEVVARSWVTPRFSNPSCQPGDTFVYLYGIGGNFSNPPLITTSDTTMSWTYTTWGGPEYGAFSREVRGKLIRQGVETDTTIKYFIAPGATSVVEINW
ncbi:MAG: hypothetical protein R6V49_06780 [Bacteroidales bacterium]